MISQLKRKIGQVASDSVLRRWLIGRAFGRHNRPTAFTPHQPPYVQHLLPLARETATWDNLPISKSASSPQSPLELTLLGTSRSIDPEHTDTFFSAPCDDIELELARHRFAWIPLTETLDAHWVSELWQVWRKQFLETDGWAWHPYTAAERAVNILDAVRRCGMAIESKVLADDLATHSVRIAQQLEYFGEHDTSNHLANNGRGLYRLGCALQMPHSRELGYSILCQEAERIILEGGSLREGSSHYHMLYVRNYLDVWLAALRHGHPREAEQLQNIAKRLLGVAKRLTLPGRLPLMGDISPDCPPAFLAGIETGSCLWTRTLSQEEQKRVQALASDVSPADLERLRSDGWIRADTGPWSLLTSVPAGGWPFMPGHAHQDIGSAEIHFDKQPLFVDPARGAYGETGEAALYRSSAVHGGLRIDNQDPYPANKPYYSDSFRDAIAGPATSQISPNNIIVTHRGYRRLGVETVTRAWAFDDKMLSITDSIQGHGQHNVERALVTPHDVKIQNDKAVIGNMFSVHAIDARPQLMPVRIWRAYGQSTQGTRIVFNTSVKSSWKGTINIEVAS